MRVPDLSIDDWCLISAEATNAKDENFDIPDLTDRESLKPGDMVKLVFHYIEADPRQPVSSDSMWVLIREKTQSGYLGMLTDFPMFEPANPEFVDGMEVPFLAQHVFIILKATDASAQDATLPPRVSWEFQSFLNLMD